MPRNLAVRYEPVQKFP